MTDMWSCVCGRDKVPEYAFCEECYLMLPAKLRRRLWQFAPGSFTNAVWWLREHGRLSPTQLRDAVGAPAVQRRTLGASA